MWPHCSLSFDYVGKVRIRLWVIEEYLFHSGLKRQPLQMNPILALNLDAIVCHNGVVFSHPAKIPNYFNTTQYILIRPILSPSPPRSSAPRRSLCLVSGSATAATVPRRPRFVPLCVHRSTNAARAAYPNSSGLVEVLHIVFVPPAAQAKAAAIRRYGRSQALPTRTNSLNSYYVPRPDNHLPLRRADNSSVNSAVVCSLRYSPSSGRWLYLRLKALL